LLFFVIFVITLTDMVFYASLSDQDLADLTKSGDEAAFQELFNRYDRLLFTYVYKKLQDKEEAKDVVQDVFIALWNSRETLELTGSLAGYLYAAVRNRALNVFRNKNVSDKYIASLQYLIDNTQSADHLIRERDITTLIEKEIAALPPKMREVFELRRTAYLSNREIAEKLDISEQTVATHMKRALKVLRMRLGLLAWLYLLLH